MRYISTRGRAPAVDFSTVLAATIAPDGGLYVPQTMPHYGVAEHARLADLSYPELAATLLRPFIDDAIPFDRLDAMIRAAAASFTDPAVAPLRRLADEGSSRHYLMELFHGPSLAFKDVAMQMLARLLDANTDHRQPLALITATSGDTGAAVVEAFRHHDRVNVYVLYPHDRISAFQRRQMTTSGCRHIHAIAVDGTFDDCQDLVKTLLNDADLHRHCRVSGANSINWARIMAQSVYYAAAALKLGTLQCPVRFCVPTGNSGNIFAAWCARAMGMPIGRLMIASNSNDILYRFVETASYVPEPVIATASPSMDIQRSSNLERLLFDLYDRDPEAVRAFYADDSAMQLDAATHQRLRTVFAAMRCDEDQTRAAIRSAYDRSGILVDPHTAVGLHAAATIAAHDDEDAHQPIVTLATAHPAKFADVVIEAVGMAPIIPAGFADLDRRPERVTRLKAVPEEARALILDTLPANH